MAGEKNMPTVATVNGGVIKTEPDRGEAARKIVSRVYDVMPARFGRGTVRRDALLDGARDLRTFAKDERKQGMWRDLFAIMSGGTVLATAQEFLSGETVHPVVGALTVIMAANLVVIPSFLEARASLRKRTFNKAARKFEEEAWRLEGVTEASTDRINSRMQEIRNRRLFRGGIFGSVSLGEWVGGELYQYPNEITYPVVALTLASGIAFDIRDGLQMRRLKKEQKIRRTATRA